MCCEYVQTLENIYYYSQIKNIPPHLEQNISLPFSFPFPVKYCKIIQAGVSKLILKRSYTRILQTTDMES